MLLQELHKRKHVPILGPTGIRDFVPRNFRAKFLFSHSGTKGWKPESSLSAPGIEPGPPAHMSEHVSERLTL